MPRLARSEPVLTLQRRQWLLYSGPGWVPILFSSFVLIYLSQALTVTCVARFSDRSRSILCMGSVLVVLY